MTSTALALLQSNKLKLTELDRLIMEEAAQDESAYISVPTRIKISPGGVNFFSTSDNDTMKTFDAIVVISQMARGYWPEKGTGSPPMCASPDGSRGVVKTGITDAQYRAAITARDPHPVIRLMDGNKVIPPFFDCLACPLSLYNSVHQGGSSGKAQACKALRRLVVLVDGWAQPALLTLPPTSLDTWDKYCSSLARSKSAYYAVWTTFALEAQKSGNGDPYSVIAVSVKSKIIDIEHIRAVLTLRPECKSLLDSMGIASNEYEVVDVDATTIDPDTGEIADPPF